METSQALGALALLEPLYKVDRRNLGTLNLLAQAYELLGRTTEAATFKAEEAEVRAADGFVLQAVACYERAAVLNPERRCAIEQRIAELRSRIGL